uniref:Uncharacterized protein n=1 Tax=Arundo donax TaxID=35708 RepID=A0A0A8ZNE3_ARUDO
MLDRGQLDMGNGIAAIAGYALVGTISPSVSMSVQCHPSPSRCRSFPFFPFSWQHFLFSVRFLLLFVVSSVAVCEICL